MKRYRKVTSRFWEDPRIALLTDAAIVLCLYIFTHPQQTALGAFRGTAAGLAEERRWKPAKLRHALDELLRVGLVIVNPAACYIGVPGFFLDNQPESTNVVRSWRSAAEFIPDCAEKDDQLLRARQLCLDLGPPFVKAFDQRFPEAFEKAFPQGSPKASSNIEPEIELETDSREQEQEQERNPDTDFRHEPASAEVLDADDGFEEFWQAYPKKQKRDDAHRVWKRLAPSRDLQQRILASVAQSRASPEWLRERGRFIPQPVRWLTDGRWEDQPIEIPSLSSQEIAMLVEPLGSFLDSGGATTSSPAGAFFHDAKLVLRAARRRRDAK